MGYHQIMLKSQTRFLHVKLLHWAIIDQFFSPMSLVCLLFYWLAGGGGGAGWGSGAEGQEDTPDPWCSVRCQRWIISHRITLLHHVNVSYKPLL